MSAAHNDGIQSDLARVLSHVLELFAALQHHARAHTRLEDVVEAGALASESREDRARRRASARQALAASQATMDQINAEVERSIQQLRRYVHRAMSHRV
jgi:hypothetical protein